MSGLMNAIKACLKPSSSSYKTSEGWIKRAKGGLRIALFYFKGSNK
jgi:hypothetical protein